MTKPTVNLNDLNLMDPCEKPYEFEYIDEHKQKTGVFLSVLGSQSKKIRDWTLSRIDLRGESDDITASENLEHSIEGIATRIVGWRGITQEYSHKGAFQLCNTNQLIREQVLKHSENLANFTESK